MAELKSFLAGIYDALSEAEMTAIAHGQSRRAELRDRGVIPRNMAVPVYHASNFEVTLDVGVTAEETEDGTQVFIEETSPDDASSLTFSVELFELIEEEDLGDIDYGELLDVGTGLDLPPTDLTETPPPTETGSDEESTTEDDSDDSAGDDSDGVEGDDVEAIDGIGPTYGERLRVEGIETKSDLRTRSAAEIADLVSTESHTVSAERTTSWLGKAGAPDRESNESEAERESSESDGDGESGDDDAESSESNGESSDDDAESGGDDDTVDDLVTTDEFDDWEELVSGGDDTSSEEP